MSICLGALFVAVDLATIAFAQHHGDKAAAGPLLGLYGLGSAIAGVWYGTRRWRAPQASRLTVALAATVLGVAPLAFMPGIWPMAAAITAAGLGISATLASSYRVAEMAVPAGQRTEAMSWLTTAAATGTALGAPLAGRLIDLHGAPAGYLFAFAAGLAAVAIAVLRRRDLASRRAQDSSAPGQATAPASVPSSTAYRASTAIGRPRPCLGERAQDQEHRKATSMNSTEIGRVTSSDGTSIAFERVGTGPAVILVDAAGNFRGFSPMPQLAEALAQHFTAFTYDRRGKGASTDTLPYAVDREIEDLQALIDLAGGSAFVHGFSSGATLALLAAERGIGIAEAFPARTAAAGHATPAAPAQASAARSPSSSSPAAAGKRTSTG